MTTMFILIGLWLGFIETVARALPFETKMKVILDANKYRCHRCKGTHPIQSYDQNKGRSSHLVFSGYAESPQLISKISLMGASADKPWKLNLKNASSHFRVGSESYYYFDAFAIVAINDDTRMVRIVYRNRSTQGDVVAGESINTDLQLRDREDRALSTFQQSVRAEYATDNDAHVFTNPFDGKRIVVKKLRELDLKILFESLKTTTGSSDDDFTLFHLPDETAPLRIYFVVPVYREFYNQNIGALLLSVAGQDFSRFDPRHVHVVFNVNHRQSTDEPVAIENRETVEFLRALSQNQVPAVRKESLVLKKAIVKVLASGIRLHVIDNTTPGYATRNIGKVRNDALNYVFSQLDENALTKALVAQMDADSRIPRNYLNEVHHAFFQTEVPYALLSMHFGTEIGSNLQTYQRLIVGEISYALYAFLDAYRARHPLSGSPRIVATARALKAIGGVPLESVGEDTALVAKLSERFPGQGRWLHGISVETSFRGRADGYDARYYLRRMEEPVQIDPWHRENLHLLKEAETKLDNSDELKNFRVSRLVEILREREAAVRTRQTLLRVYAEEIKKNGSFEIIDTDSDLGFFSSPEFPGYLKHVLETNGNDVKRAVQQVTERFPHLLLVEPPPESLLYARLVATTDTLLMKDHLPTHRERFALLPTCSNLLLQRLHRLPAPAASF